MNVELELTGARIPVTAMTGLRVGEEYAAPMKRSPYGSIASDPSNRLASPNPIVFSRSGASELTVVSCQLGNWPSLATTVAPPKLETFIRRMQTFDAQLSLIARSTWPWP